VEQSDDIHIKADAAFEQCHNTCL